MQLEESIQHVGIPLSWEDFESFVMAHPRLEPQANVGQSYNIAFATTVSNTNCGSKYENRWTGPCFAI